MILDAVSIDGKNAPTADVIIIGSGPVGIAAARRLAKHGLRILVLEAGGERYDQTLQADMFSAEQLLSNKHYSPVYYRRRMLGGTSTIWGGRCIQFDDLDFETTPLREGWPISRADIEPYQAEALEFLEAGLPEFNTSIACIEDSEPALPGKHPDLVLDQIERFSRPTNVWQRYRDDIVKASNILLIQRGTCTHIETSDDGNLATGVRIKDSNGRDITLSASRTIVAAGGIETPRLLLASNTARSCGIGNEFDIVGRYYMTHLCGRVGQLALTCPSETARLEYRVSRDGIYCRSLLKISPLAIKRSNSVNVVFRPGVPPVWDPQHGDGVLSAMFIAKRFVSPEYAWAFTPQERATKSAALAFWRHHAINLMFGVPRITSFSVDWTRRRIFASRKLPSVFLRRRDAIYPLEFDAEHLPCKESRITLGSTTDRLGMPRIRIDWKVPEANFTGLASACRAFKEAIKCTGVAELRVDNNQIEQSILQALPVGGHHIGTVRMGEDPRSSVVTKHGEVWQTRNLFICGSAIFPTSSFANPTLTAVALALRQSDYIALGS